MHYLIGSTDYTIVQFQRHIYAEMQVFFKLIMRATYNKQHEKWKYERGCKLITDERRTVRRKIKEAD